MAHEQSETVQDKLGRWINVFGSKTPSAGKPLPKKYEFERESYETVEAAVAAAKRRSEAEGKTHKKRGRTMLSPAED